MKTDIIVAIRVTLEHIRNGTPESCLECPVALAIEDSLDCLANVGGNWIVLRDRESGEHCRVDMPSSCMDFVDDYDEGYRNFTGNVEEYIDTAQHTAKPFVFHITLPYEKRRWIKPDTLYGVAAVTNTR